MTDQLTVTGFIAAIRDRFIERADIAPENAVDLALAALESFEDAGETVELTRECAVEIADEDLAHWEGD